MGLLIQGKWVDQWYDTKQSDGRFVREDSQFRHWISSTGETEFVPESGRYHLYVSLACPWAHRTLIFRQLKGLESLITVSVVEPHMLENGWEFYRPNSDFGGEHIKGADTDTVNSKSFLYQIYQLANPVYNGRVTVPVLWDKKQNTIVNNESSEIIRIFNSAFNQLTGNKLDFYPDSLKAEIDEVNAWIYDKINNGVYKAGFATTQSAYEEAFHALFTALDQLEQRLAKQRYIIGDCLTEADWRLFTTLIRFDSVYVGHFKTNLKRIDDYPNLSNYLRELYQYPGIDKTVNFEHIKQHYYYSHQTINPSRIVPTGPEVDYMRAHIRNRSYS